jgi:EmrB/QacA subfamily drug resistance transporter
LRLLTLVIAAALFLESLVSTVIATSLAAMAADLSVDPVTLKLAFTAYFVALAIFIPISGWCADRFGAKTVFRAAIAVFTLASVACALAWDLGSLVAGRFLQGVGGALMLPVGRLILLRAVPRHDMIRAMAWMSIPALFAPVMGPPVGGFITTFYHWRGIFWLNVPVGILAFLLATWVVPQVKAESVRPLDLKGFLLTSAGLSLTIFGITLAGSSTHELILALGMSLLGVLLLAAYLRHARRVKHPIIELRLLRIASFRIAMLAGVLFRVSTGAIPFLLPLMLQVGFGMNAFESGSLTFASAVGAMFMKIAAAPILQRYGFRRVLVVNALFSSLLLAACAFFTAATPALIIVGVLLTGGFFRSLQFTSLNTLSYADISRDELSLATSFVNVVQQLSLSAGVAVAALVLDGLRVAEGRAELLARDFSIAFLVISLIAALSTAMCFRLRPDAGAEVSGHRPHRRPGREA